MPEIRLMVDDLDVSLGIHAAKSLFLFCKILDLYHIFYVLSRSFLHLDFLPKYLFSEPRRSAAVNTLRTSESLGTLDLWCHK